MDHPRMYDERDPWLARVREIAAAFPQVLEVESWGWPTFRAGKRIFAVYGASEQFPRAVVFKPEGGERPALVQDPRFIVPPYFGARGWLALDLDAAPVDWTELHELLDSSFRQVALRRMVRALDLAPARAPTAPAPDQP